MTTTLTREALLKKCKPRYEEVEIDGLGTVGIRSISEVKRSRRTYSYFNDDGTPNDSSHLRRVHAIVDQVMVDEKTPMFQESDIPELAENSEALDPLFLAVDRFNGDDEKKEQAASGDSSES